MKAIRTLSLRQLDEDWYTGTDEDRQEIMEEIERRNDIARIREYQAEDARD